MFRKASLTLLLLATVASITMAGSMGYNSGYTRVSTTYTVEEVPLWNTTLLGEKILASQVVCRNRWGTPMPPDGKGGYSLIARVNPDFIAFSNVIPPVSIPPYTYSNNYKDRLPYRVKRTRVTVIQTHTTSVVTPPAPVVSDPAPPVTQ